MFLKQALQNFSRLRFAHRSHWFLFARGYIFLVQLGVWLSVLMNFAGIDTDTVYRILAVLDFANIRLHTLVCSVIGMDKLYILHLISTGIVWVLGHVLAVLDWEKSNYLQKVFLISHFPQMLTFWIFNIRTRILYLSTFRMAVTDIGIDNQTLFRNLFKWWILMHLILIPCSIYTAVRHGVFKNLLMWLDLEWLAYKMFEIKMYLALTPDNESFSYVFSTKSLLLEKFYVFCAIFYIANCLAKLTFVCVGTSDEKLLSMFIIPTIVGEMLFTIQWIWLYFYAKKKLDEFVFRCLDEDSGDFDEFEVASKALNPWESLSTYEPKHSF